VQAGAAGAISAGLCGHARWGCRCRQ
jgi:hypothetical protein